MISKLQAVESRFEELCAKSEQPDFYADPKKAAAILRERNDLEPIITAYRAYCTAQRDMEEAEELMRPGNAGSMPGHLSGSQGTKRNAL